MHWRNSMFQIRYFLAGKCHTPDEAYRLLQELYEDRDVAIRNADASHLRQEAKRLKAESILEDPNTTEIEKLEAQADLVEMAAFKEQSNAVLETAMQEREYIKKLIEEVDPQRKYKHLTDNEAHQRAQQDEWREELLWRAENFLASQGTIPSDHLSTMRLHPDWEQVLLPRINQITLMLSDMARTNTNGVPTLRLESHKTPLLSQPAEKEEEV